MSNLYKIDFYAWTQEQAELLRHQEWQKLDLAVMETNLAYKTFPAVCGYMWEDILSDRFFPGEPTIELEEEF